MRRTMRKQLGVLSGALNRRRGHAVIEVALMSPWILLLFIAIFNFGFYSYAAIATQNAARIAVLATAAVGGNAGSQSTACQHAVTEMSMLPNIASIASTHTCTSLPLIVTATPFNDAEGMPASRVAVTYQSVQLFPLPYMMGRMTLTRVAEMRVYRD